MVKTRQSTRASTTSNIHTVIETIVSVTASEPPKKRVKVVQTSPKSDELPTGKIKETRKPRGQKGEIDPSQFLPRVESHWKVGAYVSAAGGVENAVTNAASIGANAFALFLKSQRKWESPPLNQECIVEFKKRMKEYGYDNRMVLPHGSCLINLGNPDTDKREKSYVCFLDDLKRCEALDLELYNFHPGSTVGETSVDTSLGLIADCINRAHKETNTVIIVLENMAGAGNIIGSDFAHLAGIIKLVDDKSRVGVCLDTCKQLPSFLISKATTFEPTKAGITKFDELVGLKYLCGMHLNDSKTGYNSKKDRHENIGLGHLGLLSFLHILQDPRTQNIPLILETPSFEQAKEVWGTEIAVLQRVSAGEAGRHDDTSIERGTVNLDALIEELKKSALKGAENDKKSARSKAVGKVAKAGNTKATGKGSKRKRKISGDEQEDPATDDEERSG
ncbi:hypothetical protein CVT25_009196 [Psilocybe cyanescens]|uniref:Apurinic-apyrimidinic endonuclease 1 n=1 Tax=Psilocybe cyanescens TaxID=93625 RepID=A0A409WWD4_PSICY|nr:hypothetical protein CVT25_009196 [Psilocybe cyanescens]